MIAHLSRWRARLLHHAPGAGTPAFLGPSTGQHPVVPQRPRVLVIRPDHLGDLVFTGPAIARLRQAWPSAELTMLVGPWGSPVAERLPGVDHVQMLDFPWFNRRPKGTPWAPYAGLVRGARRLRGRYDVALILRDDDWWSAWLAALAGIPIRAGHDDAGVRAFATHVLPVADRPAHTAAAGVALVAALAGEAGTPIHSATDPLSLRLAAGDHARAVQLLAVPDSGASAAPGDDSPRPDVASWRPVAIHPGSGAPVKRWRSGAWGEVIRAVTAPGEAVVLTGGPDERALTAGVAECAGRPVLDLAGQTDLGALAAVFARCRLVLGPDCGPLHLAVAVGTPTVHLFGPASARRFGPWGPVDRHAIVGTPLRCAPCGRLDWSEPGDHPCIRTLGVAQVIAAARRVERMA